MILQLPAAAPIWMQAGAAVLLVAHIGGGSVGMASGTVALLTRKGARAHRLAGDVFFAAMLAMTGVASVVAPLLPEARWTNTLAGVFTFYLVATGWTTVMRRPGESGRFEVAAMLGAAGVVAAALFMAITSGPIRGGQGPVFLVAGVAVLAVACDLRMILGRGVSGPGRIARHLWRMCAALAIALGSFFLGQQKFLPHEVRGSPWLALPMLATLALMAFWLVRVRIGSGFRARPRVIQPAGL